MKTLMAMIARGAGTVRFLGEDIPAKAFEIAGLGFVPEDRASSGLTVMEIRYRPQPARSFPTAARAVVDPGEAVRCFTPVAYDRLVRMSGGEQQMLTVARTLMGNPLLVLLDEPSEGVAPVIVEEMAATIIDLKKEGLSVLLSEQNIHFAELVSDRVYVLEKGQLQWQGRMSDRRRRHPAQLVGVIDWRRFTSVSFLMLGTRRIIRAPPRPPLRVDERRIAPSTPRALQDRAQALRRYRQLRAAPDTPMASSIAEAIAAPTAVAPPSPRFAQAD
jgi:branched-chain amino acid transport system ATP-binding protein